MQLVNIYPPVKASCEGACCAPIHSALPSRFDVACCATQEQFRRETKAITRTGQIKGAERHEKDDRHRLEDRSRYVLGWSNVEKVEALEGKSLAIALRLGALGAVIVKIQNDQRHAKAELEALSKLGEYTEFHEIDWQRTALELERLVDERQRLESTSDVLIHLTAQLKEAVAALDIAEQKLREANDKRSKIEQRQSDAEVLRQQANEILAASDIAHADHFETLGAFRADALGEHHLSIESCDSTEHRLREWLQEKLDAEDKKLKRLRERIIQAMSDYRQAFRLETADVDASVDAASEYQKMLDALQKDDLPRFETQFKELLNENTIREVANFQSQLNRERETIRERMEHINGSLTQIDYNDGRYIRLEAQGTMDPEIRDFQLELRACTEGTLTGSADSQYSEAKFIQVKHIIERFTGREGQSEQDRRWTNKVTDVRNWFVFAASERWREDDREHEHYSDSVGKSGGQKEKLAYTILAASLAYQFGLEWGEERSRSFRFVVIDEAFGRGSDESAQYGLELFKKLNLQLLIVTPLQKIHVIEPFVSSVGFVQNDEGRDSKLRNLSIQEYRAEKARLAE